MSKIRETLSFSEEEETELINAVENMMPPVKNFLTVERRAEVEDMARATLIALRAAHNADVD